MDLDEQLREVREQKHREYLRYADQMERGSPGSHRQNNADLGSAIAKKFGSLEKYCAGKTIAKFIISHFFFPECINEDEVGAVPGIYRFRMDITNFHGLEYSERGLDGDALRMHREQQKMLHGTGHKILLFRYCFDVRELYPVRNQKIELYGEFYCLQPADHERLNAVWRRVNGQTPESIIYLGNLNYYKSLCHDSMGNKIDFVGAPEPAKIEPSSGNRPAPQQNKQTSLLDDALLKKINEEYFGYYGGGR